MTQLVHIKFASTAFFVVASKLQEKEAVHGGHLRLAHVHELCGQPTGLARPNDVARPLMIATPQKLFRVGPRDCGVHGAGVET